MKRTVNDGDARGRAGWLLWAGGAALGALVWARYSASMGAAGRQARAAKEVLHEKLALEARSLDHDLRSPVGAMAVALELLRTADDPQTRREAAEVLERQIARLTTLTDRLHELAQALGR